MWPRYTASWACTAAARRLSGRSSAALSAARTARGAARRRARPRAEHHAVGTVPPSMMYSVPVMAPAQGEARNAISLATSRTIANLIAQSLAQGRRVLFVSEKIAALDVVYRRLREIGLGEFCLELHSSKARKLDVLAQLQSAWASSGKADSEQWRAEADKLKRLRDALNIYVERLHQRRRNGLSLFDAIGTVSAGHDVPTLPLTWPAADHHDHAGIEQLRNAVDRLEVNAQAIGHTALAQHPLALVGRGDWSPTWQQQ